MIVSFAPYQFTLMGTETCGQIAGEIHTVRIHIKQGAWATQHGGRTEIYHDLPVNLGRSESELLACGIANDIEAHRWFHSDTSKDLSISEACMRRGGICSVAHSAIGRFGPYQLPFSSGFERHVSLFHMPNIDRLDHHYNRPSDALSLTVMTGMAVKAMAADDWEAVGKVLNQAWRLRLDTIPQSVMEYHNRLILNGAWGCSWVGPDVIMAVGDRSTMAHAAVSDDLQEIYYRIDQEGARPCALINS
jgi:hypothetical protein